MLGDRMDDTSLFPLYGSVILNIRKKKREKGHVIGEGEGSCLSILFSQYMTEAAVRFPIYPSVFFGGIGGKYYIAEHIKSSL